MLNRYKEGLCIPMIGGNSQLKLKKSGSVLGSCEEKDIPVLGEVTKQKPYRLY